VRAVLDTSIFIAHEQGRSVGEPPEEIAVSVVTISELRFGVLATDDLAERSRRLRTLESARRVGTPLPIDEPVADELARLRAALKAADRRMNLMDAWIAATAMRHKVAVCTQDADFDAAQEAGLLEVVRV